MNIEYRDGRRDSFRDLDDQEAGDVLTEIIGNLSEVERMEFFRNPLDDFTSNIQPNRHERRKQAALDRSE